MSKDTANQTHEGYPPPFVAWRSTGIIFLLTAIALADRMAISMLIGPIKQEFGIGDFQASLLIGVAFTASYVVFLLPVAVAADRFSRAKVLGFCLLVWSIATLACGFATGFLSLFILRMVMGAGEAGIGPCSHGIIGESFPREKLTKPLAIQGIGFQVGPAAGVAAAGAIVGAGATGAFEGIPVLQSIAPWRGAFVLIALPGLFAILLVPFLHTPVRMKPSEQGQTRSEGARLMSFVRQHPRLMVLMLGAAGISAISTGVLTGWVPEYLQRSLGVSPAEAGSMLGIIMLLAAFGGQGLFSILVDHFAARGMVDAPLRLGLVPVALAVPLAWLAFSGSDSLSFYPLLLAFALSVAPFNAINNSVAQQIAPPQLRSRISALFVLSISIVGFAIGPTLVGWISEFVLGEERLGEAIRLVSTGSLVITLILVWLARKPFLACMQSRLAASET